jgi:hypothetical protein
LNKAVREKRLEELEAKGVNSWTSKEVGEWIESVGYPQYSTHTHPSGSSSKDEALTLLLLLLWAHTEINFTKNHITGSVLLQKLDMEVLKKELGITSYGARAEILDRIASIPYQRRKRALRPSSGIHSTPPPKSFPPSTIPAEGIALAALRLTLWSGLVW